MEATPKELLNYEKSNGECPFDEWLGQLDSTVIARIRARLKREALGNLGDVKPVGQGVSELRLAFGSGYRIYFSNYGEEIIVLLSAGDKDSQNDDIETAKTYW